MRRSELSRGDNPAVGFDLYVHSAHALRRRWVYVQQGFGCVFRRMCSLAPLTDKDHRVARQYRLDRSLGHDRDDYLRVD